MDAQPAALVAVRSGTLSAENGTFELAYYDVPERRITRAGATLSRRLENGKGPKVVIGKDSITLEVSGKKVVLSKDGLDVNGGALKVT